PITLCGGNGVVMSSGPPTLRWKRESCVKVWPRTVIVGPGSCDRPPRPAGAWPASAVAAINPTSIVVIAFIASSLQCGGNTLRGERHGAHADAGGVEDRVADRGGDDRDRRFAGAARFDAGTVDENALDRRDRKAERQAVIGAPVDRRHLAIVPGHFLAEGAAEALQRAALELIAHAVGIRDRPAVLCDDQAFGGHLPRGAIDLDLRDQRDVAVVAFIEHAAA